jgi:pimeloyl-ACP methyl ester carboxylesterase
VPYAERAGLRLYYERAGSGQELLFVPGWCCDHTFYAPQFEYFERTHTVTTVALRGCGLSDSPPDGYDISTLADDVAWLCAEIGIERPVVVGHSLGGMVAVELGARHPFLPRALVADDPGPVHPTPIADKLYPGFADQLAGPTGEEVRRAWVLDTVGPTADDELREKVVDTMCSVPLPVARAVIEGVAGWNGVAALLMCVVPLLFLASEPGGSNDASRLQSLRTRCSLRDDGRRRPLPPARGARAGERDDRALPDARRLTTDPAEACFHLQRPSRKGTSGPRKARHGRPFCPGIYRTGRMSQTRGVMRMD